MVAALCLGTSLSLEIPVLHRGGKRQERAEMEQAVCICTCCDGRLGFLFFFLPLVFMLTQRIWNQKTRKLHFSV